MCLSQGLLTWTLLLAALTGPVSSQDNVSGAQGQSVNLTVHQTLPPVADRVVSWYFKNISVLIVSAYTDNAARYSDQYNGRCVLYPNTTLRLDRLTAADQGNYILSVQNIPGGVTTEGTVHLTVYSPLTPPVLTSNVSYPINGSDVTLHCDNLGQTVTSYSFRRDQQDVCSPDRVICIAIESKLHFHPILKSDEGNYTCTIQNPISNSTSKPLPLPVAVPVSNVLLQSNTTSTVYLWVGKDSVSLTCSALGTEVHFSWNVDGAPLPQNSRYHLNPDNSTLTFSLVQRNDNGSFTCTASNWFSNQTSNPHVLNLAWHPENQIMCSAQGINETVQLMCSWPGGFPAASVSLQFQQKNETGENQVIKDVSKSTNTSEEDLVCYGSQGGLEVACSVKLGSPQAVGFTNNSRIPAQTGDSAMLKVSLLGNAARLKRQARAPELQILPSNFSWFHDATPVNNGDKFKVNSTFNESSLTVSSVSKEDNGSYECRAENLFGSTSFLFLLDVTEGIPTTISPDSTSSPPDGLSAGEIAGIVIGVLAGLAIIGIIVVFILKSNKKKSKSKSLGINNENQIESTPYAVVMKKTNGGVAEASITDNPQDDTDDVKYAVIRFQNQESAKPASSAPETEYSTVNTAQNRQ